MKSSDTNKISFTEIHQALPQIQCGRCDTPGCKEYAEDFALQEIDGQALMLLKADHLMSAMSMKLGPALKICAKIQR